MDALWKMGDEAESDAEFKALFAVSRLAAVAVVKSGCTVMTPVLVMVV